MRTADYSGLDNLIVGTLTSHEKTIYIEVDKDFMRVSYKGESGNHLSSAPLTGVIGKCNEDKLRANHNLSVINRGNYGNNAKMKMLGFSVDIDNFDVINVEEFGMVGTNNSIIFKTHFGKICLPLMDFCAKDDYLYMKGNTIYSPKLAERVSQFKKWLTNQRFKLYGEKYYNSSLTF